MSTPNPETMAKGFSRQSSRTSFSAKKLLLSPRCRFCLCTGFLFFAGVMFGVYMDAYFLSDGWFGRSPRMLEKSWPGLSIKKDQFRDYIPRLVFVDISYGPPHSLDLFMETYPDAHKYTIYVFLADESYAPLYAKFNKVNLLAGTVPSTENTNATALKEFVHGFETKNPSVNVTTVNFSTWLQDNIYLDEFAIVKMTTTPKNEAQIARLMAETAAVEWVSKYYTSTDDATARGITEERFSVHNLKVQSWDDEKFTFSDFDSVNPVMATRKEGIKVSECMAKNNTSKFVMILYMSEVNQYSLAALRLLSKISILHAVKLPVTVLFPVQYLLSQTLCGKVAALNKQMSLGLYLEPTAFSLLHTDENKANRNYIRNKLVSAEHCFAKGNVTLDFILSSANLLRKSGTENFDAQWKIDKISNEEAAKSEEHTQYRLTKDVVSSRLYTIISNVIDVTPKAGQSSVKLPYPDMSGALLGFDISLEGVDVALLQLLESSISAMIPLSDCVAAMETLRT